MRNAGRTESACEFDMCAGILNTSLRRARAIAVTLLLASPSGASSTDGHAADASVPNAASVTLAVTVSIDPPSVPPGYDFCGPSSDLTARVGQTARWCYTITNSGTVILTVHTLQTVRRGNVLTNFPYVLA